MNSSSVCKMQGFPFSLIAGNSYPLHHFLPPPICIRSACLMLDAEEQDATSVYRDKQLKKQGLVRCRKRKSHASKM